MKKRVSFWDNYKGILMLLVVFGHFIYAYATNLPDSFARDVYVFVYSFHMPAFVFCSGYFSKSERSRSKESLVKLLLYYIVFNTLMGFFEYLYKGTTFKFLTPYYSYWYILSLIIWRAMIGQLSRVKFIVPVAFVISLLVGYISGFTNELSIRRTLAFFVFFAAGYHLDSSWVEGFLARRKARQMALCMVGVVFAAAAAFWATRHFGITSGMTMMNAYGKNSDMLDRLLVFGISAMAIIGMFLVVPNCEIPLLSKVGRNSLLIYLAHRFVTLVYYRELFPYRSYTYKYLVYAMVAAAITCVVFGGDKLNQRVNALFNKTTKAFCDHGDKRGTHLVSAIVVVFSVMLCITTAPDVIEFGRKLLPDIGKVQTETMEPAAAAPTPSPVPNEPEKDYVLSAQQRTAIENSVKIAYVGDMILLKDQVTSAKQADGSYDFSPMFEYAAPYLSEADLAVGVFEGPAAGEEAGFSTSNYGDGNSLYLNFPDEFAQAVKDAGIDLVTVANNHLLDRGLEGAMRTLDVLDAVGLIHSGAYRNQEEKDSLTIVEVEGLKIAVLSYLKSVNNYKIAKIVEEMPYLTSVMPMSSNEHYDALVAEIEGDFAQAKAAGADMIMVMAHMGTQFKTSTDAFQRKWNKLFAELGADIILGDHAHVVQPVEYVGDTVVINCPGNFANSYTAYNGDATAIVEIYIDRESKKVSAASVIPMYTQEMRKGSFRALPIYEIMTNRTLYDELWAHDHARLQEVQKLITDVMVGEAVALKNVRERYFYIDNQYYREDRSIFLASHDYSDREFYRLIDEAESITFIGDSITEGTKNNGHPWYEWIANDFDGKKINNISKGSYTVKRILEDFNEDILNSHSDLYVVAIGTNDIRYRNEKSCAMTSGEYVEQLALMTELIKQSKPDAKIVFIAPWMTLENDSVSKLAHDEKNAMTDAYSNALREYAQENAFGFIDANPYLREYFNGVSRMLYTNDGIHPNEHVGIELYAKAVFESCD